MHANYVFNVFKCVNLYFLNLHIGVKEMTPKLIFRQSYCDLQRSGTDILDSIVTGQLLKEKSSFKVQTFNQFKQWITFKHFVSRGQFFNKKNIKK